MGEALTIRAASDLEGASRRPDQSAAHPVSTSCLWQVTPPTRPPGEGRARPGVNPGDRLVVLSIKERKV